MGINSWLEDELYQQYLHDHGAVDDDWRGIFEQKSAYGNGASSKSATATQGVEPGPTEQLVPLRGAAARVAQNMEASLSMRGPSAEISCRVISWPPVARLNADNTL